MTITIVADKGTAARFLAENAEIAALGSGPEYERKRAALLSRARDDAELWRRNYSLNARVVET